MLSGLARRFRRNEDGNIAMITALCLLPVMAILGASLDFMRALTVSNQLQASIDGAALAAANLNNYSDVEVVVGEFVDSNLSGEDEFRQTLQITVGQQVAINSKTVGISAIGELDTYFLGLVNIDKLKVEAYSIATQSVQNIEIAMALDISSSMRGSKLTSLKDAAVDFVEEMLDDDSVSTTSISVIPFGGTVNIGEDLFEDLAVELADADINPSEADYNIKNNFSTAKYRFTEGDHCIEYAKEDFSNDLMPDNERSQLPHFWRWWNFHPWCPLSSSAALFNTNDLDDLTDHINGMTLSDGTGMDAGALWALQALAPQWEGRFGGDFAERPAAYDDETLKIYIVMTDGAITAQDRVKDYTYYNTHTNRPDNEPATGNGKGNQGNNKNKKVVLSKGNSSTNSSSDTAVGRFKDACETAKNSGAISFTIGFKIKAGSLADELLQECASDPSKYYLVEDLDIQSAFESIAAAVNSLRITG